MNGIYIYTLIFGLRDVKGKTTQWFYGQAVGQVNQLKMTIVFR
jgi:hypothetical protein